MLSSSTAVQQDEAERLKFLLQYDILDTLPDPAFDEITRMAAAMCNAGYAFIGFLDWSRVWFKSSIGFTGRQMRRNGSPCQFLLLEGKPLLIDDAMGDHRFGPSGIVLDSGIECRSYAGAPLSSGSGAIVGTLAVCSTESHAFSRDDLENLQMLARQVVTRIELYATGHTQENVVRSRQRSEQALTVERNFVAAVLNSISALVLAFDTAGRIVRFNRASETISGYSFGDLAGRFFPEELFPPQDRQTAIRVFEQVRASKTNQSYELDWRTKSGGTRRIAWTATPLNNAQEEVGFVIMTGVDVTEQRTAETALRASETRYRQILDSVGDGIWGMDLQGSVTFINRSGADLLGYSPQELLGENMHALVHHSRADGSPYPAEESALSGSLKQETPLHVDDDVFWCKDGKALPVEYVACPLVENGEVDGVVVAFADVTERRRLDRMKDEFIATVSHELRTPLTSMRAALGLVASGALSKRPEKIPQMLEIALGNCDRLVRLVNDIVDFERIGSGTLLLHKSEWNAIDLLRRAMDPERLSARRAGLVFRIDAQPVDVWVDDDRVLQVLGNLIRNAIKFSEKGGEIRLAARASSATEVTFEVQDQGAGIPEDKLDLIFERFQQADASDARLRGGTGLGLALCRGIVLQHGGRIWAQNNPGKGSTFFFTVDQFVPKEDVETGAR